MQKVSTISSKGQVVIPKSIRTLYSLEPQTKVIFEPAGDTITLKLFKSNFAGLNSKLAHFEVDKKFSQNWENALDKKLKQSQW